MQESRLFRILYYLLEKGHATAPELAEKFEVSVRTIYRDVDALSSAGIPVYVTTGRKGGIQFLDDYVLNRAFFSDEEKAQKENKEHGTSEYHSDVSGSVHKKRLRHNIFFGLSS